MSEDAIKLGAAKKGLSKLVVGCLAVGAFGVFWLVIGVLLTWFPFGSKVVCNRAIDSSIEQWKLNSKSDGYPNMRGESFSSLSLLPMAAGFFRDYRYIPGLQPNDPTDLVLFYVNKPGKKYWHGDGSSPFKEKRWVVLSPDFSGRLDGGKYEFAEALTTTEFKKRLTATLEFLEKQQRPYWTNAVREHRSFLETIRD